MSTNATATAAETNADTASPESTTPNTPFYRLGGHDVFRAITNRFYDLMENDSDYAELRAMHAPDLAPMRVSLSGFLAAWAGGPRDWLEENPGKCMMSMHKPFTITEPVALQWANAMNRAVLDTPSQDEQLSKEMARVLGDMAIRMAPAAN